MRCNQRTESTVPQRHSGDPPDLRPVAEVVTVIGAAMSSWGLGCALLAGERAAGGEIRIREDGSGGWGGSRTNSIRLSCASESGSGLAASQQSPHGAPARRRVGGAVEGSVLVSAGLRPVCNYGR